MDVIVFKKHMATECEYCGELIVALATLDSRAVSEKYRQHVAGNSACAAFHAALPALFDVTERWCAPLRTVAT